MMDIKSDARTIEENVNLASKQRNNMLNGMLISTLHMLDRINQSLCIHSLAGLTHLATYEAALKMIAWNIRIFILYWV